MMNPAQELPLHEQLLNELRAHKGAVTRVMTEIYPDAPTYNHEASDSTHGVIPKRKVNLTHAMSAIKIRYLVAKTP